MTRVLARALLMAAVAGFALVQSGPGVVLVVWEAVLLVAVTWALRGLPSQSGGNDPALFRRDHGPSGSLPRPLATAELSVVDALSGHLEPDRRLLPTLRDLAGYRLSRLGAGLDTEEGRALLGEENWRVLAGEDPMDGARLERLVGALERL